MQFFNLYILILSISHTCSIVLNNKKICKDCKYFIADQKKCQYFNDVDLVTGTKTYKYASIMRDYDDNCGENAKYFEENKIKFITVPYYFLKDYWTIIPTVFITVAYIITIIINK